MNLIFYFAIGFCRLVFFLQYCVCFPATYGELNLGMDYFEGDILLTQRQKYSIEASRDSNNLQARALIKDSRKLWVDGIVPYVIADDLSK